MKTENIQFLVEQIMEKNLDFVIMRFWVAQMKGIICNNETVNSENYIPHTKERWYILAEMLPDSHKRKELNAI